MKCTAWRVLAEQQPCTQACVICQWCGMETKTGNHGKVAECVVALEQKVSALRLALSERERIAQRGSKQADDPKPRWKSRTA